MPGRAQTVRAEEIERLALRDLLPDSLRCTCKLAKRRRAAGNRLLAGNRFDEWAGME